MLNQGTLVLKCVTFAQVVKLVVKMFVDFALSAVFDK